MNSVRVEVGSQKFTYADPEKAFAAADSLCKLAEHQEAKAAQSRKTAAAIREQATALAARRKAMAEATAAKKRAAV